MRLMRRGRLSVLAAIAVGLAAGGVAYASIPGSGDVISGCYKKNGGALRVIDAGAGVTCNASETPLTWNQTGPKGATGDPGPSGPTGPKGPIGPSNAYTDYEGGHNLVSNGGTATIASVTLPAGHFTLSADVVFEALVPPLETTMNCTFISSGTVHMLGAEATAELGDMPVIGDLDVTSNGTTVELQCSDVGTVSAGVGGSLIATQVGTTTAS
jgi:hypothetical protein